MGEKAAVQVYNYIQIACVAKYIQMVSIYSAVMSEHLSHYTPMWTMASHSIEFHKWSTLALVSLRTFLFINKLS